MDSCSHIDDENILEFVHQCNPEFFESHTINSRMETGSYGLILIVTSKDEYERTFAVKIQSAAYDIVAKTDVNIKHIKPLSYIVHREVLALCRFRAINELGVADQFPTIEEYFVCPISSVPKPYNGYITRDLEAADKDDIQQYVEASIITMSYIEGKVLEHFVHSMPKTAVFDFYYGIFAAVLYAKIDFMLDFHVENAIVTPNKIDTYFIISYRDPDSENDHTEAIIKIPTGYPRLKFIDFGEAEDISYKEISKNMKISQAHRALYPHLIVKYMLKLHFPLLSTYMKKLNNSHQTIYDFYNDIMKLLINMMGEFTYVGSIPNNTLIYSLQFPE